MRLSSKWFCTAVLLSGCMEQSGAFSHRFADNQAVDLQQVLARLPSPNVARSPENALGQPLAVVTTHADAGERKVAAIDIASGEERWSYVFDAQTRPDILGDLVIASDRSQLVALDLRSGQVRFTVRLPADLAYVGATRAGDKVFYSATVGALGGARRLGVVEALDARTGRALWRHEVEGVFGQPAASDGVVVVPWERQNLAILDGESGLELARLRSTDDVLAWTFADPSGVYYGHRSVYRLTELSVTGRREDSTHRELPLPVLPVLHEGEVARELELWDDGFIPKPGARSARGRIRMYFRPAPSASVDEVSILGDTLYFVYYRYVFAYDLDGALRWTRILNEDVIGAEPTETGLFTVGEQGHMELLDRQSGRARFEGAIGTALASVSLDVAGFESGDPADTTPPDLKASLSAIAVDPDNRLVTARAYAVGELARIDEPGITRDLLDLYTQQSMPGGLKTAIGNALRARRSGVDHLVEALGTHYDFLEGTDHPPLEVIVPALLEAEARQAVPALLQQLADHETPAAALPLLLRAIAELGDPSIVPALQRFLVLYRNDSGFAGEKNEPLALAALGIFRHGGPEGREMLTAFAAEPRTTPGLKEAVASFFNAEREQAEANARREAEEAEQALAAATREREAALPTRLSTEQINAALAEHEAELRVCIAEALEDDPELAQVRLTFILEGPGRARNVSTSPNSGSLPDCMRQRVESIEFPRFRQRRMQARYVVPVRARTSNTERSNDTAEIPPDAPWWTAWERTAAAHPARPDARPWWELRDGPAPVQVATPTPAPAQGNGSAWWTGAEDASEGEPGPSAPPTPDPSASSPSSRSSDAPPSAPSPQRPAQRPWWEGAE